jgi:tRNA threonylcarbamoyladenosine biosynthesis protein TsaB
MPAFCFTVRRAGGDAYTEPVSATTNRSERPRLLALDSATEHLAVAVVAGDRQWAAEEAGGPRASQRLLPLVFELLAEAAVAPADLDAIAFGRGPGAFTGLRSACSVAQGLALGLGCPVLALDSLAIWAEDAFARHGVGELWVAIDARMDEVYAAAYRREDDRWTASQAPALWTLPALAAAWRAAPPRAVAGNALAAFAERLPCGPAQRIDSVGSRADALARLARAAWNHGVRLDAADALPLYLRDKVALTTAERSAQRAEALS